MSESASMSTSDRVKQICNDLYRQGTKPSVRMILSMMDDITSTSTVHKPYREWMDELEASQQSLYDKLGFSEEFTQSFMREITRFGVEAEERFKSRTLEAREQRDTALEDLERTEDKYVKQSTVLEQQAKELRDKKTEIAEQKRAHEATVQELRTQLEEQQAENRELSATNETLRTEMAKAQVQLDNNNSLVNEVKTSAGDKDREIERLRDDVVGELRSEIVELSKTNTRLTSTLEGKTELIQELKGLEPRLNSLADEKAALSTEIAKLQQRVDDSQRQVTELTVKAKESAQTEIDLRGTIAEQSSVIKSLTNTSGKKDKRT